MKLDGICAIHHHQWEHLALTSQRCQVEDAWKSQKSFSCASNTCTGISGSQVHDVFDKTGTGIVHDFGKQEHTLWLQSAQRLTCDLVIPQSMEEGTAIVYS